MLELFGRVSSLQVCKIYSTCELFPLTRRQASHPPPPHALGIHALLRSPARGFFHHWAQLGVPGEAPSGALHCGSPAPPLEKRSSCSRTLLPSTFFQALDRHRRRRSGGSRAWPLEEMAQTLGWQPTDARDQTWRVYGSSPTDAAP